MSRTPRIFLPFVDDSTLIFASAMDRLLQPLPCETTLAYVIGFGSISDRQMASYLPDGPQKTLTADAFLDPKTLGIDAIVSSRLVPPILMMLGVQRGGGLGLGHPDRPQVIAFQGGLDFTPRRGFAHRRAADGVFLISQDHMNLYGTWRAAEGLPPQKTKQGHPAFLRPQGLPEPRGRAITFFAQAISPLTRRARLHIVQVLAAMARRDPSRPVRIKLRHLRDENQQHLHRERWDYASLVDNLDDRPRNLELLAGPMEEALSDTGLGLTCTSTAAADLVSARIPTMVHLDYIENYFDPLAPPMAALFEDSGLIHSLEDVLHERWTAPSEPWINRMFCGQDLGEQVLAMINDHSA